MIKKYKEAKQASSVAYPSRLFAYVSIRMVRVLKAKGSAYDIFMVNQSLELFIKFSTGRMEILLSRLHGMEENGVTARRKKNIDLAM